MGMSAGMYSWNRQFESYRDLPLDQKLGRFVVMTGESEPDEFGRRHPESVEFLGREFALPHAVLTHFLSVLDDKDTSSFTAAMQAITPVVNPVGSILEGTGRGGNFGFSGIPAPSIPAQVITNLVTNEDPYRRQPIVPLDLRNKPAPEQFDPFTSDAAIRLGEATNTSPKKLDYLLQTGMVGDLVAIAGLALDRDAPPPHIAEAAAELSKIDELFSETPELINRERRRFLNSFPAKDRQAIEDEAREVRSEVPFVTSMINRFHKETRSSQRTITGRQEASAEFGTDVRQTSEVGMALGEIIVDLDSQQQETDRLLREGVIDGKQWREAHQTLGAQYAASLMGLSVAFPDAAQFLAPEEWEEFKRQVATGMDRWPDPRSRGTVLAAAWRAIPMDEIAPGVPDYKPFFQRRDEFMALLSPEDQNLLQVELEVTRTPTEQEFYQDQQRLRKYWDLALEAIPELPEGIDTLWQNYLDGNSTQKKQLRDENGPIISRISAGVARMREGLRVHEPVDEFGRRHIDALLIKWVYVSTPLTIEGQEALDRRLGAQQPVEAR